MLKKITFILLLITPVSLFSQDWVPVITGFGYEASECHLSFSCYVKNIDDDNDADATMYKIIIFNIADNSEIFNTDVVLDHMDQLSSSPSKHWNIDLPALAGYRPDITYKIAVVANTKEIFEFDKKNNRVESAQFACGRAALNNASANPAGGSSEDSKKTTTQSPETTVKDLTQTAADMKASRDQMIAQNNASMEEEKKRLTAKVENLNLKLPKRIAERDGYATGSQDWSDLAYEVADLEFEKQIAETELEKVTDELAYGMEGLSKSEKERYKTKLAKLESQQSETRKNKKNGVMFPTGAATTTTVTTTTPAPVETKQPEPVKEEAKPEEKETEEKETFKRYTAEEIAQMSTYDVKRLKADSNTSITRRKLTLKTRSNFLTPAEKATLQTEIEDLTKLIELAEAELTKR